MSRGQQFAVGATCLLAAVTYAGAVTTWAMGVFVLPGVVGAALLASLLAARRVPGLALGATGVLVLGWAELANLWTGTAHGPAARATAFAAGWTVVAVVLAHSRRPALFLGGVAGIILGAVVLGAAGEVRIVVVVVAVSAALTLASIERSRRNWVAPPRRGVALVLLSVLAGVAATGAVLLQADKDPRSPALFTQGREYPGIKPAWTDPLATDSADQQLTKPPPTPHRDSKPTAKPTTGSDAPVVEDTSRSAWFYAAAAIALVMLLLAVGVAARWLITRLAWRRVRRRLAVGAPADQVVGAWAWARMRLEACRMPLAVALSPDAVLAGHATPDLPSDVFTPLRELAATTTTAAFSPEQPAVRAVVASWAAAGRAEASARELLSRTARARLAFRGPAFVPAPANQDFLQVTSHWEVVVVGRKRSRTRATTIAAAAGIVVAGVALIAGLRVFGSKPAPTQVAAPLTTPVTTAPQTVPEAPEPNVPAPSEAVAPPVPAPSEPLAPGDSGPQVTILQRALAQLGFSAGVPDGTYGPATTSAVERFQLSQGLPQVGLVGPQTLAALRLELSRRAG